MKAKAKITSAQISMDLQPYPTRAAQPYLTKRVLTRAAQRAGRAAEKEAMEIMGYVVTVIDDWVVRKNADGTIEKIRKVEA